MKKASVYGFLAVAVILILFLSWSLFPGKISREHSAETESETAPKEEKERAAYQGDEREILDEMMNQMTELPASSDASLDYLRGMVLHHQASIAMEESYLEHGGIHEKLVEAADNGITQHRKELSEMNGLIKKLESNPQNSQDKRDAYMNDYLEMLEKDNGKSMDDSGRHSLDRAFTEGMILHHRMALDLAELALDYSDDEQVKDLAERIIREKTSEVDGLRVILQELK